MARRRAKKTFKKVESSPVNDGNDIIENEAQFDKEANQLCLRARVYLNHEMNLSDRVVLLGLFVMWRLSIC
nr:hypothetical protein CFP56_58047 [Quercus suber]